MSSGKPQKKIKVQKGEGLWLMSFSDLSMILISFFIMMLSYSKPDKRRTEQVQEAIEKKEEKDVSRQANNLKALQEKVEKIVKAQGLSASAQVSFDVDGLKIEFADSLLFTPGSADANPKFQKVVGSVMSVIADTPDKYRLIFEGHTDDLPVIGGKYPSNWELSAVRGITLLNQFARRGVNPTRMSVSAFADTKPKVSIRGIKDLKQLKAARSANRRVVIRIE